jgi:non-specific protein-tyrosine kinase
MNTNVQLLKSRPFLEEVILRLSLKVSPLELSKQIKVEVMPNTELLSIEAEGTSPEEAETIADTLATLLIEERDSLFSGSGKSARESLEEQVVIIEGDLKDSRDQLEARLSSGPGGEETGSIEELTTKIRIQEETYAMLINEYDRVRIAEGLRANSISVVEPAIAPLIPSKPNIVLNVILGILLGLSGGVGLAFLIENLDTTIHTSDDLVEAIDRPLLGWIPYIQPQKDSDDDMLIMASETRSPASEAFRLLRSNVLSPSSDNAPRTLLVASPEPEAGKSTILANLAATIAQSGRSVIVIDSDFGRPMMHKLFHVPIENGLSDVLFKLSTLDSALKTSMVYGVRVLTSGSIPSNPGDLLESPRIGELIHSLQERADVVLFDSPPILAVADASILAPMVDGVLLVVARREASEKVVFKAVQQLDLVGANLIGAVFNKADPRSGDFYFKQYKATTPKKRRSFQLFKKKV